MESVSAAEEAELTRAGCRSLLDPRFPWVLLFDIGGGSTEILTGRIAKTMGL